MVGLLRNWKNSKPPARAPEEYMAVKQTEILLLRKGYGRGLAELE